MRCPKCQHEQESNDRCEQCGIYFAKYAEYLQKRESMDEVSSDGAPTRPTTAVWIGLLVTVALTLGAFWVFKGHRAAPANVASAASKPIQSSNSESPLAAGLLDLEKQLAAAVPAQNEVEKVRNASVLIQTGWGSGSGFFVSRDCRIVTNRHVVQVGDETMSRAESELSRMRSSLDEMRASVAERRKRFYERCVRCDEEAYRNHMREAEQELGRAEELVGKRANMMTEVKLSRPRVVLADGSEHGVTVERISTTRDLALLKLEGASCPFVQTTDEGKLRQGDTLYTVGNPIGLKFTVTSGIFSGHYRDDTQTLLQTDAPINPGNSGGPLFDKQGRVVGVNTYIAAQARGIGFAIPISTALAEFGL